MKLSIFPDMILRIPQFPMDASLENEWDKLKESIAISSPDFHRTIRHLGFADLKSINPSISHSIWKYFNRAKHRATPYGSFAGVGVLKGDFDKSENVVTISTDQVLHKFISWEQLLGLEVKGDFYDNETLVFSNSTFYKIHGNIRYVTFEKGKFQLSEVECTPFVLDMLAFCRLPISIKALQTNEKVTAQHLGLLTAMIEAQLLLTDKHPNIIGDDYFNKNSIQSEGKPSYLIAERKITNGHINKQLFKHIKTLAKELALINKEDVKNDLKNFIYGFQKKFESRWIPIMIALDPELGIGYGDIIETQHDDAIINEIGNNYDNIEPGSVTGTLKSFVLSGLGRSSMDILHLEDFIAGIKPEGDVKAANSFSALGSIVDGQIVMHQFGGATANALAGRFSIASNDLAAFCKDIAKLEQDANPNVLFFDVAYMAEYVVDNVNRRQKIYPFQLSILNFDTTDNPLTLEDIYLSVLGGELILYSKSLKKRLIPRLASAYNYKRSDLALFRLLCDVQGQGIATNLFFDPAVLVPGLKSYPRIQYHNVILSAAKWKIQYAEFAKESGAAYNCSYLKKYLDNLGLPDHLLMRNGDRTLIFDTNYETDLTALSHILKKAKGLYLEEGFIPKQSVVRDRKDNPYANEFLLALTHKTEIYKGVDRLEFDDKGAGNIQTVFSPGSEWLYYEIFTHPLRADTLLQGKLHGFAKQHKRDLLCWFFIRYNEGGNHIRFRMRIKQLKKIPIIIEAMSELLSQEMDAGIVSDFTIKTYKRETERYGLSHIEKVEHHFCKDCLYVIQLLKKSFPTMAKYRLCIDLLLNIRNAQLFSASGFEQIITHNCDSFLKEHKAALSDFKLLNNEFKTFRAYQLMSITKSIEKYFVAHEKSLYCTLISCPEQKRAKLFSDLVHMHINRLFASKQRTHEMVIYYFLSKELLFLQSQKVRA